MRARTKVVKIGTWWKLTKMTSPTTGRVHYVVQVDPYLVSRVKHGNITLCSATTLGPYDGRVIDQVRLHFDPHTSRGGRWATKWKFGDRKTAERLITMALLKWS